MLKYYILENQNPVPVESFREWNLWMSLTRSHELTVMCNEFNDCLISTKFVGIDLGLSVGPKPMIFETLVIGGALDGKRSFYPT